MYTNSIFQYSSITTETSSSTGQVAAIAGAAKVTATNLPVT